MRISRIGFIKVRSMLFSATAHVGDCTFICPYSNTFAVQREISSYLESEGNLNQFLIFSQPIPKVTPEKPIRMSVINENPFIDVGVINIFGMSTAPVLQIGSTKIVNTENRTKHIRQLLPRRDWAQGEPNNHQFGGSNPNGTPVRPINV